MFKTEPIFCVLGCCALLLFVLTFFQNFIIVAGSGSWCLDVETERTNDHDVVQRFAGRAEKPPVVGADFVLCESAQIRLLCARHVGQQLGQQRRQDVRYQRISMSTNQ